MKLIASAFLIAIAVPCLAAPDCSPHMVAQLALSRTAEGAYTVPVMINGKTTPFKFTLNTHTIISPAVLDPKASASVQAPTTFVSDGAKIDTVGIGAITLQNVRMGRMSQPSEDGTSGTLGVDILSNYDLEIDLAGGRLSLSEHEACPGSGVTWSTKYSTLPFDMASLDRPSFTMNLDGVAAMVTFNYAVRSNSMPLNRARLLYVLERGSPGVKTLPPSPQIKTGARSPTVELAEEYEFKVPKLSAANFALEKLPTRTSGLPDDPICDGKPHDFHSAAVTCKGGGDYSLGTDELKAFHVYFAMKDRMLYFTPATVN